MSFNTSDWKFLWKMKLFIFPVDWNFQNFRRGSKNYGSHKLHGHSAHVYRIFTTDGKPWKVELLTLTL